MTDNSTPRQYPDWQKDIHARRDDAAYTFGYHLIKHCRTEAINSLPKDLTADQSETAIKAVDIALHNVMDMLEGFWSLPSGDNHSVEYDLQVVVKDNDDKELERISISPALMDLPIGYWKWAQDNEFR
jgi:hypothetical protein